MTVYNVNLGIGWASSGVEYAQKYRDQSFRKAGIDAKFIFSDLILDNNIGDLTANMGFKNQSVIWLYNFFTDIKIAKTSYTLTKFEASLKFKNFTKEVNNNGKEVVYKLKDNFYAVARLCDEQKDIIDQVVYQKNNTILRRDFYSYTKYAAEYYLGAAENNRVVFREFYNEDGSVAYTQHLNNDQETYEFTNGEIIYSKDELYLKMLKALHFVKNDVIILDREDEDKTLINGQLIFENHGLAKIIVVVHADHYDKHFTNDQHVLWNNFYEYQFSHASEVASFVVATPAQKKVLEEQFQKYYHITPRVDCIPVGSLLKLTYPVKKREPFSFITASRLAKEKHLDWIVKAVIAAKNQIPELKLDIYGKGSEGAALDEMIKKHQAEDYIHLKGQHDLKDIYVKYPAYIAASTSEGFGLSLLEAIGSGLAMIGFDVPYGDPTFIKNNENGYLLPYDEDWNEYRKVELLTKAIIKLFKQSDLKAFNEKSYQIAEPYLTDRVAKQWKEVLGELTND